MKKKTEVVRMAEAAAAAAAGLGPGRRRPISCLRLSHSFLAAAVASAFVVEEEGPLTIARSRADCVAMVVSIPRPTSLVFPFQFHRRLTFDSVR